MQEKLGPMANLWRCPPTTFLPCLGLQPILIQSGAINPNLDKPTSPDFVIFCISNSFYLRVELLKGRIKDQLGHKEKKILYMDWEKSEALKYVL